MSATQADEELGLLSEALLYTPPTPDETEHTRRVVMGFLVLVLMIGVPVLIGILYMEGVIQL